MAVTPSTPPPPPSAAARKSWDALGPSGSGPVLPPSRQPRETRLKSRTKRECLRDHCIVASFADGRDGAPQARRWKAGDEYARGRRTGKPAARGFRGCDGFEGSHFSVQHFPTG